MGKNLFVGVGDKARHVKALYVGVGGKARKVKKVYVGVGGKARLVYTSYVAVTGVKLKIASTNDKTCIIKAVFTPANATNLSVKWTIKSSNPFTVVKISAQNATTCTLTAQSSTGEAWLTATTPNGISCTEKISYTAIYTGWKIGED